MPFLTSFLSVSSSLFPSLCLPHAFPACQTEEALVGVEVIQTGTMNAHVR